jgi:hypothetical protein
MNYTELLDYIRGSGARIGTLEDDPFLEMSKAEQEAILAKCSEIKNMNYEQIISICHIHASGRRRFISDAILHTVCLCRWRELGLDPAYPGLQAGSDGCTIS